MALPIAQTRRARDPKLPHVGSARAQKPTGEFVCRCRVGTWMATQCPVALLARFERLSSLLAACSAGLSRNSSNDRGDRTVDRTAGTRLAFRSAATVNDRAE